MTSVEQAQAAVSEVLERQRRAAEIKEIEAQQYAGLPLRERLMLRTSVAVHVMAEWRLIRERARR